MPCIICFKDRVHNCRVCLGCQKPYLDGYHHCTHCKIEGLQSYTANYHENFNAKGNIMIANLTLYKLVRQGGFIKDIKSKYSKFISSEFYELLFAVWLESDGFYDMRVLVSRSDSESDEIDHVTKTSFRKEHDKYIKSKLESMYHVALQNPYHPQIEDILIKMFHDGVK